MNIEDCVFFEIIKTVTSFVLISEQIINFIKKYEDSIKEEDRNMYEYIILSLEILKKDYTKNIPNIVFDRNNNK